MTSAQEAVARAVQALHDDLTQAIAKSKISQAQADDSLRRIQPVSDLKQLSDCDLVVEAIVEQLEPKQSLFLELERIVAPRHRWPLRPVHHVYRCRPGHCVDTGTGVR